MGLAGVCADGGNGGGIQRPLARRSDRGGGGGRRRHSSATTREEVPASGGRRHHRPFVGGARLYCIVCISLRAVVGGAPLPLSDIFDWRSVLSAAFACVARPLLLLSSFEATFASAPSVTNVVCSSALSPSGAKPKPHPHPSADDGRTPATSPCVCSKSTTAAASDKKRKSSAAEGRRHEGRAWVRGCCCCCCE